MPVVVNVYLAGPIFGCNDEECKDWRDYCREKLEAEGIAVRDPMVRDYRGSEGDNTDAIVEGDKEDINNSDILIINYLGPSVGTAMETFYAWERNRMNILVSAPETLISPWMRYHCHYLTSSYDEAINLVRRLARFAP